MQSMTILLLLSLMTIRALLQRRKLLAGR